LGWIGIFVVEFFWKLEFCIHWWIKKHISSHHIIWRYSFSVFEPHIILQNRTYIEHQIASDTGQEANRLERKEAKRGGLELIWIGGILSERKTLLVYTLFRPGFLVSGVFVCQLFAIGKMEIIHKYTLQMNVNVACSYFT
jgi:hypothetical protein